MKNTSWKKDLLRWLEDANRVVVVGIGNPLRGDDFVGMALVQEMKGKVSHRVRLVESEFVPEGSIQDIVDFRPTHMLVIDTALMGVPSGTVEFIGSLGTAPQTISTHTLPLHFFCKYIEDALGAKVALLAIQPKKISLGEGLSWEIEESKKELLSILLDLFRKESAPSN